MTIIAGAHAESYARVRRFAHRVVPSLQRDIRFLGLTELDWRTRLSVTTKKYTHRLRHSLRMSLGTGPWVEGHEFKVGSQMDAGHLQHVLVDTKRAVDWMGGSQPSFVAVDVGAHNGETAVAICLLRRGAQVTSFEPHPASFSRGAENVSPYNVTICNVGLSDFSGMAAFEPDSWDAKSRFVIDDANTRTELPHQQVRTGDEVVDAPSIDFLKIDVEGHEGRVLRGLAKTLCRVGHVMVEWSLEDRKTDVGLAEVVALLNEAGLQLLRVGEIGWSEDGSRQVTADLYFGRASTDG